MKTGLIVIFLLHGLLHLPGFFKAFGKGDVIKLAGYISRPMGLLWLLVALVFIMVAVLILMNKQGWPFFAIAAVILSQTLIVMSWQDAKWGTIVNILLLIISVPALGRYHFEAMVKKEVTGLLEEAPEAGRIVKMEDLAHLPASVQNWLLESGVVGKEQVFTARLKQQGQMKTQPNSKWMPFEAVQYFILDPPGFNWAVQVEAFPLVHLSGRDKLTYGEGEMKIKLLSLINVVDEKENEKVNSGSMLRFLGEICWIPSAALNNYISWEEIDSLTAKAIFKQQNKEVSGIFRFSSQGELLSFEAERYYGGDDNARQHPWLIEVLEYKVFDGIKVPSKCKVTWKLPEGDFNWLNLEITTLEYNNSSTFK
ncbi:MAG: DUF6544 family protein [Gillisia sp.]